MILNFKRKRLGMCYLLDDDADSGLGASVGSSSGDAGSSSDADSASSQGIDSQRVGGNDGAAAGSDADSQDFSIPAEYAEKEWTKDFAGKSGDELKNEIFKSLDEKYSNVPNVPKTPEEYEFNEALKDPEGNMPYGYDSETLKVFGESFKELGITKEQGQGIMKKYTDFELSAWAKHTDPEDCKKQLNELFNNDQAAYKTAENSLKKYLDEKEMELVNKTFSNQAIKILFKAQKGFMNDYGVKESNSGSYKQGSMNMSQSEKDQEYNNVVKQLEELRARPHTDEEHNALVKRLVELCK